MPIVVALTVATALGSVRTAGGLEPKPGTTGSADRSNSPRLLMGRVSTPTIRLVGTRERGDRSRAPLLVHVPRAIPIRSEPGGGAVIGWLPEWSRYYHVPLVAWIRRTTADGRFGLLAVPYSSSRRSGWIALRGLSRSRTAVEVRVDLSRHLLVVLDRGRPAARFAAATGAPTSPTPQGRYFVTDRIAFAPGSAYGSFAFGISGIQPHLPAGWTGGDQLAIHGTSAPSTIGTSSSAGCIRVSEAALARLRPLLRLGTPVVVVP